MTYDIIALKETSVFVRPHQNEKTAFFNKNSTWGCFRKPACLVLENAVSVCGRKARNGEKISVFENIRVDVDCGYT